MHVHGWTVQCGLTMKQATAPKYQENKSGKKPATSDNRPCCACLNLNLKCKALCAVYGTFLLSIS